MKFRGSIDKVSSIAIIAIGFSLYKQCQCECVLLEDEDDGNFRILFHSVCVIGFVFFSHALLCLGCR